MNKISAILLLLILGCKSETTSFKLKKSEKKEYLRWVDDIKPNDTIDKSEFQLCNKEHLAIQYFNDSKGVQYLGGMKTINELFNKSYRPPKSSSFSGLVRIRFIVNCAGKTGRFRWMASNLNYKSVAVSSEITDQLLNLTKSLNQWQVKKYQNLAVDYYQYLVFKFRNGKLEKVLP